MLFRFKGDCGRQSRPYFRLLDPPPVRVMGELGEMSECRFHTGYRPIFGGGLLDGQIKKITHR